MLSAHRNIMPRVTVEITEAVALADFEETTGFTKILRDLGCTVAIDDFGASYVSFRNLRGLNVDMLKLDGSFCDGLSHDRDNQYFVASFIDLARKLGIKTVAEWVQSKEDAEFLRSSGIDYLQGNLFGPPRPNRPGRRQRPLPSFSLTPEAPEHRDTAPHAPVEKSVAPSKPPSDPAASAIPAGPEQRAGGDRPNKDVSGLQRAIAILDKNFRPRPAA